MSGNICSSDSPSIGPSPNWSPVHFLSLSILSIAVTAAGLKITFILQRGFVAAAELLIFKFGTKTSFLVKIFTPFVRFFIAWSSMSSTCGDNPQI